MKKVNIIFAIIIFAVIVGNISGILDARQYSEEVNYSAVIIHLLSRIFGISIFWGITLFCIWCSRKIKKPTAGGRSDLD